MPKNGKMIQHKSPGLAMKFHGYTTEWQSKIHDLASQQNYSIIESFSGPGGMSLGLEWAGFNLLIAFDYDNYSVKTHNLNLGNKCHQLDAKNVTSDYLFSLVSKPNRPIDLFSGGPPCQGFSKQKRGAHLGDDRNDLVSEYIRLVREISPRFFLFENVAIFGQLRGRRYVREMFDRLSDYELYPAFYNTALYGLPQTRERFIVIGKRKDIKSSFHLPEPSIKKIRTVGEALNGLPEPPEDFRDHPEFPNHQRARVTPANIHRFSFVPQGGGWQDIPFEYRLPCHQRANVKSGGWPDVYGRLEWNGQCPTITGGFDSFSRGRYGHPLHDRPITPREAARLQGFPDDFVFLGTRGDVRSQIGNVVPPPLAEAIGLSILKCLLETDGLIEPSEPFTHIESGYNQPLPLEL